jgi:pimeloyl-ACP methyl ester carboxylesterase
MPKLSIHDAELHHDDTGSGAETIVPIHGLMLAGESCAAHREAFRARYRVITFDLRGQGRPEQTVERLDLDSLAEDTIALVQGLGVDKPHLAGFSPGNLIAMCVSARRPDLIRSQTLIGPSADAEETRNLPRYRRLIRFVRWFGPRWIAPQPMNILFGSGICRTQSHHRGAVTHHGTHPGGVGRGGSPDQPAARLRCASAHRRLQVPHLRTHWARCHDRTGGRLQSPPRLVLSERGGCSMKTGGAVFLATSLFAGCASTPAGSAGYDAFLAEATNSVITGPRALADAAQCFEEQAKFLPLSEFSRDGQAGAFTYRLRISGLWLEQVRITADSLGSRAETRLAPNLNARWRDSFERDRASALRLCLGA